MLGSTQWYWAPRRLPKSVSVWVPRYLNAVSTPVDHGLGPTGPDPGRTKRLLRTGCRVHVVVDRWVEGTRPVARLHGDLNRSRGTGRSRSHDAGRTLHSDTRRGCGAKVHCGAAQEELPGDRHRRASGDVPHVEDD